MVFTGRLLTLVVACAMALMAQPAALAQEAGQQELLNGQTLSWTGEWTVQPGLGVESEQLEIVALNREGALVAYGGTATPMRGSSVRDQVLAAYTEGLTLETIERGEYDNVSYSIDLAQSDTGRRLIVFTLVIENPGSTGISMLISTPEDFWAAMEAAQAGISVSGASIFEGIDAATLQQTIDAATADLPDVAASPAAGVAEASVSAAGGSATIESSGTEVTWTDAWQQAAGSTEAPGSLELTSVVAPPARLNIVDLGSQQGDVDAEVLAQRIVEEESLAGDAVVAAANAEDGRKVIVLSQPSEQETIFIVYDLVLDPESTRAVVLTVFKADLPAAVQLASETVRVDGQPVFADLRELVPGAFEPAG